MSFVQNISQRIPQFHKNVSQSSAKSLSATNTNCLLQQLHDQKIWRILIGQKIYCSYEIALQQRAKVVIEGIITNSDWLKSKFIAFLANQNGRKYQNKLKESDFWKS